MEEIKMLKFIIGIIGMLLMLCLYFAGPAGIIVMIVDLISKVGVLSAILHGIITTATLLLCGFMGLGLVFVVGER